MRTDLAVVVLLLHAVDESGALSILQWLLSSRPEPAAAEQQLRAAWKMVSSSSVQSNNSLAGLHFIPSGGNGQLFFGKGPATMFVHVAFICSCL
jgi:hypothetical protein